ncbi:hypothetical protein [Hymenobacter terricola]|uniref:hypothetical protein n=1 Tax=Hymenobacter terricola TaxID=2819236 RepID=UPI001B30AB34|nr:hypothetical protein [Hymenobacter terricola]
MPDGERQEQANKIREDLKGWAQNTFEFSEKQKACMELMPKEYYEETGYQVAHALDKKYSITAWVSDDTPPVSAAKRETSVDGGWSQSDGWHAGVTIKF